MALNYEQLVATPIVELEHAYRAADAMLYAHSIGLGRDPVDRKELVYVYESAPLLRTLPTMATVLVPDLIPADLGWDYAKVLHAEQRLSLHRPLPPAARLVISKRVTDVFDLGRSRGALIMLEAEGRLAKDDTALFNLSSTVIARGDGGFGGGPGKPPPPHRPPRRAPDLGCEIPTRQDQALLFRLNGDLNPLHADPGTARAAGFPRPILHGLCTFGVACHAILKTICDYDPTLITGFDARFSAPVLPGDTIRTDMWQDGNIVSFQCTALERDSLVVRYGKCTLAG
jgi:acyl dehydratase